jgi:transcription elongation factor Elf1
MKNQPDDSAEAKRFLYCPTCNAVAAKAETVGRTVVYLRCGACGEAWSIVERRKVSRQHTRAPRFSISH